VPPQAHIEYRNIRTEALLLHPCTQTTLCRPPLARCCAALQLPEPLTGKTVKLSDFAGKQALLVMFICNHCPYVVHLKGEGLEGSGCTPCSSCNTVQQADSATSWLTPVCFGMCFFTLS
jgi:hypothetical protein